MYKEQVEVLTQEQTKFKKETHKLKSTLKEKEDSIVEHIKKNA
jgi:hypothetical protein